MTKRFLDRRSLILLLIGGVVSQAVYGGLRALSLEQDRPFALAAYGNDPAADVVINGAVAVASLLAIGLLLTGRRVGWWWSMVVLVAGAIDALHVVEAPYGGLAYAGLLVLRIAVIYVFMTPLARTVYGVVAASD